MRNQLRDVNLFKDFDNDHMSSVIGGNFFETLQKLELIHRCYIDNVTTANRIVGWSYKLVRTK